MLYEILLLASSLSLTQPATGEQSVSIGQQVVDVPTLRVDVYHAPDDSAFILYDKDGRMVVKILRNGKVIIPKGISMDRVSIEFYNEIGHRISASGGECH